MEDLSRSNPKPLRSLSGSPGEKGTYPPEKSRKRTGDPNQDRKKIGLVTQTPSTRLSPLRPAGTDRPLSTSCRLISGRDLMCREAKKERLSIAHRTSLAHAIGHTGPILVGWTAIVRAEALFAVLLFFLLGHWSHCTRTGSCASHPALS